MTLQNSWLWCEDCGGLFFAGNNNMGACPAGGAHNPRHTGAYALSNAPPGQAGWKWCANCQGLFYSGINQGVCPTHKDSGSFSYVLPQSQSGSTTDVYQPGWSWCNKCQGLFYSDGEPPADLAFNCPAGGFHDSQGGGPYFLPQQFADGQRGWKYCSKCFGLFWSLVGNGGCPSGGEHDGSSSGPYSIPTSGDDGQPGWKHCTQCQGLFYGGENLGVCPVPQSHVLTKGSENYVLIDVGGAQAGSTEQAGWNWCSKCQGLFYPDLGGVWCPSRDWGPPGNHQPGFHNPWNTKGKYALPMLGGSYNYALYNSDGSTLQDVSVTIDITEDIVFEAGNTGTTGCGFQLNAYSPADSNIGWQQYGIILNGDELIWSVDNWPISDGKLGKNIINPPGQQLTLVPTAGTIPAGYQLIIFLSGDPDGNIAEATYIVNDTNTGVVLGRTTILLKNFNLVGTSNPVTEENLAPIVAFEVVLVGPFNYENILLSSGAGTFTYSAYEPLTASLQLPSGIGYNVQGTGEDANSIYEVLPAGPSRTFSQGFKIFPVEL